MAHDPGPVDPLRRALHVVVDALAAMDPDYVIPMHCSGETFVQAALARFPQKVVRPYVGTRFVFGVP